MNGTFAEYAIGHGDYVGVIPPEVSFVDAAPILCAGLTTYKGLKETGTQAGQWVVISGVGGLGHVAVQYAKAMGFTLRLWMWAVKKCCWQRSLARRSQSTSRRKIRKQRFTVRLAARTACW